MIRPGPRIVEAAWAFAAFVVTIALFFPGVTFGDRTVASCAHIPFVTPHGPVGFETIGASGRRPLHDPFGPGHIHEANFPYRDRAIRAGQLPWWHPHEACGNPYFAGLLPGLLYPPSYLMHVVSPTRGFDLTYLLRLVLAGWFLYLLLRVHRVRVLAAYGGGLAFALSGYFVTSMNLWNAGVECLIPGLVLAVEWLVARNRARHRAFAVAMVFSVLVAGNPESSFLAIFFASVYGFARILNLGVDSVGRRLLRMIIAFGLGAALAMPQLLPFLLFLGEAEHVHHPGVSGVHAPWQLAFAWFAPELFRDAHFGELARRAPWFYCGAVAPALAIAAISSHAPRFLKRFCLIALGAVTAWYYGVTPLDMLSGFPGFAQIFLVKYLAVYVCFFVAVLTGLGIHCLARHRPGKSARVLATGALLVAAVIGLFLLLRERGALDGLTSSELRLDGPMRPLWSFPAAILASLLFLATARRIAVRSPRAWSILLLVLLGFELYHYIPHEHYPRGGDPFTPPRALDAIAGDRRTFRVYATGHVLSPNTAGAFGLNDIRYNEALKYRRYTTLVATAFKYPDATNIFPTESGARPEFALTALERLGVRYVLSHGPPCPIDVPSRGPARREFACDPAKGYLVRGPSGPALAFALRVSGTGRVRARGPLPDGAPLRLSAGRLGPNERAYLLAPFAARLAIRDVHWGGRALPLATLAEGSARAEIAPDGALLLTPPVELALPAIGPDDPPVLAVAGRALSAGRPTLVLATASVTPIGFAGVDEPIELAVQSDRASRISVERLGQTDEAPPGSLAWRPAGVKPLDTFDGIQVARLERALPRAYGVYHASHPANDEAALATWLDPAFAARDTVLLSSPGTPSGAPTRADAAAPHPTVDWRDESAGGDAVSFDVSFARDGWLVLLDNHGAGWRATVDGADAPIERANYAFRAVRVPAGTHRVAFRYTPPGLLGGIWIAVAGLLVSIVFARPRRVRP